MQLQVTVISSRRYLERYSAERFLHPAWVGVGIYYYEGVSAWRVPVSYIRLLLKRASSNIRVSKLLIGILFPLVLLACLPWVPETPRWLAAQGRSDEVFKILRDIHKSAHDPHELYAREEYQQIVAQVELEKRLE
jgi:hypothetical protein